MSKIPIVNIEEMRKHIGDYDFVARLIRWAIKPYPTCPMRKPRSAFYPCKKTCHKFFLNLTVCTKLRCYMIRCPCWSYGIKKTARAVLALAEDLL